MKTELKEQILNRIKHDKLTAFSCYDFTDLANYKTISKCIERLEDSYTIRRIINGIYCLNEQDKELSLPKLPSINDIAKCIARKNKWTICPTGSVSLNALGLSTQVPSSYIYLSTGPYKKYVIFDTQLIFKHTMSRELIDNSEQTTLLIQCIKVLGKDGVEFDMINHLKKMFSEQEKKTIIKETISIPSWIRNMILEICK